jgi:DNA polymerase delta subunit 1
LSFLVISTVLNKKDYITKQMHTELAELIAKRDPGNAPKLGDQIAYMIVAKAKSSTAHEKIEDPL